MKVQNHSYSQRWLWICQGFWCRQSCFQQQHPWEHTTQKGWFAPKGAVAEDKTACIRTPDKFRAIFGSNCDSELSSGTIAFALLDAVFHVTPKNQRGFCKGRQLCLNSVDLDALMWFFNVQFDVSGITHDKNGEIPIIVLSEFCNAFPTVLHDLLFLLLKVLLVICNERLRSIS